MPSSAFTLSALGKRLSPFVNEGSIKQNCFIDANCLILKESRMLTLLLSYPPGAHFFFNAAPCLKQTVKQKESHEHGAFKHASTLRQPTSSFDM